MAKLDWSVSGSRFYETGVDRGVLYLKGKPGIAWTGLTSVEENPSGGESTSYYIDGVKYLVASATEEFEATLSAFTYPEEFGLCDGTARVRTGLFVTQQDRTTFGFSYRTKIGSDLVGVEHGYKIHIVYNALASPSSRSYSTLGDDVEPTDFSWDITTRAPLTSGYRPTAHVVVDSRYTDPLVLEIIEDVLYGNATESARLPDFAELVELYDTIVRLTVTDHGDGTFTVVAPTDAIQMLDDTTFQITWPSAIFIDEDSYNISTL